MCWKAIRAMNYSRSTRITLYTLRWRCCNSTSGRALRVLPRADRFDRFVSVLVYVPRDRYDSHPHALIGEELARRLSGAGCQRYPSVLPGRAAGARRISSSVRRRKAQPDTGSRTLVDPRLRKSSENWTDKLRARRLDAASEPKRRDLGATLSRRVLGRPIAKSFRRTSWP